MLLIKKVTGETNQILLYLGDKSTSVFFIRKTESDTTAFSYSLVPGNVMPEPVDQGLAYSFEPKVVGRGVTQIDNNFNVN